MPDESSAPAAGSRLATRLVLPLALALVIIVVVFYVIFDSGKVEGPSMLPNLMTVDGLLITKGYAHPRRGDIVVLGITGQDGKPDEIVKRVVGIPNDTVEIRNDVAYVDGIRESGFATLVDRPGRGDTLAPVTVQAGQIYVMGDNRPVSYDSRYIGSQPLSAVAGRVVAIYMPVTRIRLVESVPSMAW